MVRISEAANDVLLKNLMNASIPPETGYRLMAVERGYRLRLDRPSERDRVIEEDGHVLFMIETRLDKELDDTVLDVGEDGDRLILA